METLGRGQMGIRPYIRAYRGSPYDKHVYGR